MSEPVDRWRAMMLRRARRTAKVKMEHRAGYVFADAGAVRVTREIGASPKTVWSEWAEPERFIEWWAPSGCSTTTGGWMFHRGCRWYFKMQRLDGSVRQGLIQFDNIHPHRRISFTSHAAGPMNAGGELYAIGEFEKTGTGTRITLTMRPTSSAENFGAMVAAGARDGAEQALVRLAQRVESAGEELEDEPTASFRTSRSHATLLGRHGTTQYECSNGGAPKAPPIPVWFRISAPGASAS